jgi:hypothetical protein
VPAFRRVIVATAAIATVLAVTPAGARQPLAAQRIWFAPGPATLDYLRLFERAAEWPRSRELVTVFKFYQQHTQTPAHPIVGPNTYDALVRADAFRRVRAWRMKTALEVGAVKEGYCLEPGGTGTESAIRDTIRSIRAVEAAGGSVEYVAMDEPWVSGRLPVCGGPAPAPIADRVAAYMAGVQRQFPSLRIGLIEAYPFSSADRIETILDLLRARGTPPAFLHIDVDRRALRPGEFGRDLPRLQAAAETRGITFGFIIWGYDGDADALFADDANELAHLLAEAFESWDAMPEQIVFQSWAQSSSGLFITPSNLPETRLYSHTNIVWNLYRRLRGATGGVVGQAKRR